MAGLREIQADDRTAAASLLSAGMGGARVDWEARFDTWWDRNPAKTDAIPAGWVLEDPAEGMVGFLGNVPAPFKVGDAVLLSCAMTSWLILPAFRSFAPMMASRFFGQEGPGIWLNTTANEPVARVCQAFGARPAPLPSLERTLYWVTSARRFLQGALSHVGLASPLAMIGELAGAVPLKAVSLMRSRSASAGTVRGEILTVDRCGAAFDQLWEAGSPAVRACSVRSAEQVGWRYFPSARSGYGLLGHTETGGALAGYLAYRVENVGRGQMRRMIITDVFTRPDHAASTAALVVAAIRLARSQGVALVETTGGAHEYHQAALSLKPYSRARSARAYLYRTKDPKLTEVLGDPGAWHATLYDGDASLH